MGRIEQPQILYSAHYGAETSRRTAAQGIRWWPRRPGPVIRYGHCDPFSSWPGMPGCSSFSGSGFSSRVLIFFSVFFYFLFLLFFFHRFITFFLFYSIFCSNVSLFFSLYFSISWKWTLFFLKKVCSRVQILVTCLKTVKWSWFRKNVYGFGNKVYWFGKKYTHGFIKTWVR
jgi:hypothetical protein